MVRRLSECNRTQDYDAFVWLMFVLCVCVGGKMNTKGNKHMMKVRKRIPQKGKQISETPAED